jgi:hypothetical protein
LKESRNKLVVGFMKVAVENRMMITQIKRDMDDRVTGITIRLDRLEEKGKQPQKKRIEIANTSKTFPMIIV